MKIIILGGGDSPEREVSLRSAASVAEAAKEAGYSVETIDPKYEFEKLDDIAKDAIVLPILHGANGEDGVIQQELEKRRLAYLGSDSKSSADCFDKWRTRQILEAGGLPMPLAVLATKESYGREPMSKQPHILKVVHGGSSIGTLKVASPDPLRNPKIDGVFKLEKQAVIEELIEGSEITVPILDQSALPVIEIIPPKNEEFDYRNKYNGRTEEICPPKNVSEAVQKQAQELAEKVHELMGCRHLSRVDMMVDNNNKLYILEINTIPGLTDQSLYPRSAATAGLPMPQLVQKFVAMVERDYNL